MKRILTISLLGSLICGSLQSQSLQDYLSQGLQNHPGIHASDKRTDAAVQAAGAQAVLPPLQVGAGAGVLPVETRLGPAVFKASLMQRFPWFGQLELSERAGLMMADALSAEAQEARLRLALEIRNTYFEHFEWDHQLREDQAFLLILREFESLSQSRYENGQGSLVDVIRVGLMIDEVSTMLESSLQKEEVIQARFQSLAAGDSLVTDSLEFPSLDSLLTSLDPGHPALESLNLKASAASLREELSGFRSKPSFGLGLEYMTISPRTDASPDGNGRDVITPVVQFSVPLFRNGSTAASSQAVLEREAWELKRNSLELDYSARIDQAVWAYRDAEYRHDLNVRQIRDLSVALQILISAYTAGEEPMEEVLRMQQDLLSRKKELITAIADAHAAIAVLYYFTGRDPQF